MKSEEIGNYIRNSRRRRGLSLRELANLTGISFSTLNKYENGIIIPKQDKLEKIQYVFGSDQDSSLTVAQPSIAYSPTQTPSTQTDSDDAYLSPEQASHIKKYLVMDAVEKRANGFCELCGNAAPFEVDGVPFLEFHHVRPLKDGGTWTSDNLVALCPVCNAKISFAPSAEDQAKLEAVVHKN